jgi:hypothetical protein
LCAKKTEQAFFTQAFALLAFTGFFAFALFTYQPPRYFYLIFPALAVFGGIFLDRLFSKAPLLQEKCGNCLAHKPLFFGALLFASYAIASNAVKYFIGLESFSNAIIAYIAFFAIVFIALFALLRKFPKSLFLSKNAKSIGFALGFAIIAFILATQSFYYANWVSKPSYSLLGSSMAFGEIVQGTDNSVAAGQWCPALAIETNILCHRGGLGAPIKEHLFKELGINFLVADEGEWEQFGAIYNSYQSLSFEPMGNFDFGRASVGIYRVAQKGSN